MTLTVVFQAPISDDLYEQLQVTEENAFKDRMKIRMDEINLELGPLYHATIGPRLAELQAKGELTQETAQAVFSNYGGEWQNKLLDELGKATSEEMQTYKNRLAQAVEREAQKVLRKEIRAEVTRQIKGGK